VTSQCLSFGPVPAQGDALVEPRFPACFERALREFLMEVVELTEGRQLPGETFTMVVSICCVRSSITCN